VHVSGALFMFGKLIWISCCLNTVFLCWIDIYHEIDDRTFVLYQDETMILRFWIAGRSLLTFVMYEWLRVQFGLAGWFLCWRMGAVAHSFQVEGGDTDVG
jgi:hypothetical protein